MIEARLGLDAAIRLLEDLLAMENIRIEKLIKRIMKKLWFYRQDVSYPALKDEASSV
jgi:hypothetical protein